MAEEVLEQPQASAASASYRDPLALPGRQGGERLKDFGSPLRHIDPQALDVLGKRRELKVYTVA